MKHVYLMVVLLCSIALAGCAAGSATAGYSLKAGSADELHQNARKSIVDEVFEKCKEYCDNTFVKKTDAEKK